MRGNKIEYHDTEEFFHSKRLYTIALLEILRRKGSKALMACLQEYLDETSLSLFPNELTEDSIRNTIMGLNPEDIKFKS